MGASERPGAGAEDLWIVGCRLRGRKFIKETNNDNVVVNELQRRYTIERVLFY